MGWLYGLGATMAAGFGQGAPTMRHLVLQLSSTRWQRQETALNEQSSETVGLLSQLCVQEIYNAMSRSRPA
jgi:hypothetical protein